MILVGFHFIIKVNLIYYYFVYCVILLGLLKSMHFPLVVLVNNSLFPADALRVINKHAFRSGCGFVVLP